MAICLISATPVTHFFIVVSKINLLYPNNIKLLSFPQTEGAALLPIKKKEPPWTGILSLNFYSIQHRTISCNQFILE